MKNYFDNLPRDFRSKKSLIMPFLAIGIALVGLISVVSFISESFDIRNLAAPSNLGHVPTGCYYVRGDCTGSGSPGATGSCKPILVCPTITPSITPTLVPSITAAVTQASVSVTPAPKIEVPPNLSCQTCLNEGTDSLCLNLKDKTSGCVKGLEATNNQNKVCVVCRPLPPNPTPYKCIFRPSCLDASPPCTDQNPVEGWCIIGAPSIIFQQ